MSLIVSLILPLMAVWLWWPVNPLSRRQRRWHVGLTALLALLPLAFAVVWRMDVLGYAVIARLQLAFGWLLVGFVLGPMMEEHLRRAMLLSRGDPMVFVERPIFDDFTAAVAEAASQAKIGPGLDPSTELGPLVSQEQFDRVSGYLAAGLADGARALTGGKRWGDEGFFIEPTVFVDVDPSFSIVQEEIFGPVVAAMPFDADTGVAAAANDSIYGLAAGIWTTDLSKAHRTARQIKAGSVWVNQYNGFDTAMPFGGYKQSGWGRELGSSAIELYTQTKAVNISL